METIEKRGRTIAMLVATAVAMTMLVSSSAYADTNGRRDPNDAGGRLDIARVSHSHFNGKLVHRIKMHQRWSNRLLANPRANLWITARERGKESTAEVFWRNGRWICAGPRFKARCAVMKVKVFRPNKRTIVVRSPRSSVRADRYRWWASTSLRGAGGCKNFCWDTAPKLGRPLTHRL